MRTDAPANGEDGVDARAHYEAAQKLYDEGEYEKAIAEFEIAYRKKPHPNVLYNIGQAQERRSSTTAHPCARFEHYPRGGAGADDPRRKIVENRLRVLRNLPARVSVTTIPEHVHARIVDKDGATVARADTPNQFTIPAGDYALVLEQPGLDIERHEIHADIGQPYFYQYRLQRTTAQVMIESEPSGARVFIDDRLVGETPYRARLELGAHSLLLEYPDYPWHRERLPVDSGETVRRVIRLERPPRSGRTELVIGAMAFGGITGPLLVGALSGSTSFTQLRPSGVATLPRFVGRGHRGRLSRFVPHYAAMVCPSGKARCSSAAAPSAAAWAPRSRSGSTGSERCSKYGITLLGGADRRRHGALIASLGRVSGGRRRARELGRHLGHRGRRAARAIDPPSTARVRVLFDHELVRARWRRARGSPRASCRQ